MTAATQPLRLLLVVLLLLALGAPRGWAEDKLPNQMPGQREAGEIAEWWTSPAGTPLGPYSEAELMAMAEAGELGADSWVWREGMAAWQRLSEVEALGRVAAIFTGREQQALEQEMLAYLQGRWSSVGRQTHQDGGEYRYEAIESFRADGSYATSITRRWMDGSQPDVVVLVGSYSLKPADEKTFTVTVRLSGGDVAEGHSVVQVLYTIVDRNHMRNQVGDEFKRLP